MSVAARRLWPVYETYHATTYFAPEAAEAYRRLGLKGGWMGYFASRAAPLGAAPPGLVTAVFFNFAPAMVARALPDAWALASPADVLAARAEATGAALARLLPVASEADVAEAAELAREAAVAAPVAGRPLYGALLEVPWPDDPRSALWHAATLLREHRGDGHVAALTAAGLDGCEAHVTQAAAGAVPRETLQQNRRWSDDDWAAAERRLAERGWLDPTTATLTEDGRAARRAIEALTDELAAAPWEHLGAERTERLYELMLPLSVAISERGGVPVPNPVGVPAPAR